MRLNPLIHHMWTSNVQVHVPPSAMLDGVHSQHFFGTGVIVHHSQDLGLVVVDQNTVAISVSDVMLSFAAHPIEIPAEVCYGQFSHDLSCLFSSLSMGSAFFSDEWICRFFFYFASTFGSLTKGF